MAMIPTFTRDDLPTAMPTGAQADPGAFGQPGQAAENLGQATVSYGAKMAEVDNYDWTANNVADFATSQNAALLAARKQAAQSGDYKGVAQNFNQQLFADQQARIDSAPTSRAADAFKLHSKSIIDDLNRSIVEYSDAGEWNVRNNDLTINRQKLANASYLHPESADTNYALGMGMINGARAAGIGGDKVDWAAMQAAWGKENYGAVVRHQIDTDPSAALSALQAGKYGFAFDSGDIETFSHAATEAIQRQQAEARQQANENALMARGSVDSAFQDNMASIAATGRMAVPMTQAAIAAAYPKNSQRVTAMMSAMNEAQQGYVARQSIALGSPDDDMAILKQMQPNGPGFAEQQQQQLQIARAIQMKRDALAADPAAYVQQASPQLHALFQAASDDPSKLPAAVAAQDAMYDHLGVPSENRPVLPQSSAAAVVRKFTGMDPSQVDVGGQLTQMANAYGEAWPRVYEDLVRAKLPASYEVLATMDTPQQIAARQDMQRALAISAAKGGPRAIEESISPDASKQIKDSLPDMLSDFRQTAVIPGANSNVGLMAKVTDSAKLLANFYVAQGQDPTTAMQNAYNGVIGDKYDFDGSMRVPKGMLPQARAATDQALGALEPQDLRASAGLPPDIASDRWVSAKQNSAWYPTQAGDGLQLMVQTRDGRFNRVLRTDGTPVQVLFKDIGKSMTPAAQPDFTLEGP